MSTRENIRLIAGTPFTLKIIEKFAKKKFIV